MSLADRLNRALKSRELQPTVLPKSDPNPVVEEPTIEDPICPVSVAVTEHYSTLEEGLANADNHSPDEFGTTVIVVENIGREIKLPMPAGKYTVDDIQKQADGCYEVHLVSDQK